MFDTFDETGLSPFGEDTGTVLPDVSNSSPDEQSTTPVGNGTGYYVPPAWESGLLGGLQTALNYAIAKDQTQYAAAHGYAPGVATMTATPQVAAKLANQRLMILGGLGLVALFLLKA